MAASATANVSSIDILSIAESKRAMKYALMSNTPIHFVGPPGIGKSAIVLAAAKELNMAMEPLLLSQCDPTDVGGFPVVVNGALRRLPLGPILRACEKGVVLFLDEISCAPPAVQGAALQLIYAREAGEVNLHPDTRIVAASNPPDQAAGGWELALPMISRLTQVRMRPKRIEVQEFFYNLGAEGSMIRRMAVDWAATLEVAADLLQIDPPAGAQAAGQPWGNPRSWERALTFCAAALDGGEADVSPVFTAGLAGNVGENAAASYMSIRKIREQLPGVKEILNNPDKAVVPKDIGVGIAVLGILAQVSQEDPCPAWVYADRLKASEVRVAAMNVLGRYGIQKFKSSKWYKEADASQTKLLRGIGDAMRA
jgi:hypothetical protein